MNGKQAKRIRKRSLKMWEDLPSHIKKNHFADNPDKFYKACKRIYKKEKLLPPMEEVL